MLMTLADTDSFASLGGILSRVLWGGQFEITCGFIKIKGNTFAKFQTKIVTVLTIGISAISGQFEIICGFRKIKGNAFANSR
jgi:hypothetical protein